MWLKKSDDWADDCARVSLSDAAYRTHDEGLLWAMRRENGGRITHRDLRRFAETADPEAAVAELVAVGFWRVAPDGWLIIHSMGDQIEPEVIAKRREKTRDRVRRHRMKAVGLDPDGCNGVTDGVTKPRTRRVTRDGSGRVGTGTTTPEPAPEERAPAPATQAAPEVTDQRDPSTPIPSQAVPVDPGWQVEDPPELPGDWPAVRVPGTGTWSR